MTEELIWYTKGGTLALCGKLDCNTLQDLWLQRQKLLKDIRLLDLSGLRHIDSAGVALILHFYHLYQKRGMRLGLTGFTDKLRALITLYKLQAILLCAQAKSN